MVEQAAVFQNDLAFVDRALAFPVAVSSLKPPKGRGGGSVNRSSLQSVIT
jgi:hypothetical protein